MPIHVNYDLLTPEEREAVGDAVAEMIIALREHNIRISWADPVERIVEALATEVVRSRARARP